MYRQPPGVSGQGPRFESQAEDFDRRAGLPAAVSERVARAVEEYLPEDGILLELGAGTGELGRHLVAGAGTRGSARRRPYLGLDISAAMLRVFARRIRDAGSGFRALDPAPSTLVVADADAPWPVADGSVGLVLASRVAHLLDSDHLAGEVARTAGPTGAILLLGRVKRPAGSVRARLRRELHHLLEQKGVRPQGGPGARERLHRRLQAGGGKGRTASTAAEWRATESTAEALAAWASKPGLAGVSLPAGLQSEILERLSRRAETLFGAQKTTRAIRETYELRAFTFAPSRPRRPHATGPAPEGTARAPRRTREMP